MSKMTCKHLPLILSSAFLLFSCGGGGKPSSSTSFIVNQVVAQTEDLNTEQVNIATRICYAYQSKSNNFKSTDYLASKYNFSISNKNCNSQNNLSTYSLFAKILETTEGEVYFSPNNSTQRFYGVIQSNSSGYLKSLCTKIQNNLPISNTLKISDSIVQILFYRDTVDAYILKYFRKVGTEYKAEQAETFKVRTQFDYVNGKILGMDEEYLHQGLCNSSTSQTFDFKQSFTGKN